MPRIPEPPLTFEELEDIERRRAEARQRAQQIADRMSEEEDAVLTAAAESDPDNPPLTDGQFARMRPAHQVIPQIVADRIRNKGGRPRSTAPRQMVTLRIPPDVVEAYRATGRGWQTRMVETLSRDVKSAKGSPQE